MYIHVKVAALLFFMAEKLHVPGSNNTVDSAMRCAAPEESRSANKSQ
jgi:hypothetical protein